MATRKAEGVGVVAMEVVDAGVDIMEVTTEATVGVMEVLGVIIMDFSFLESMVMAIVAIFTEVTAIPAIQGEPGENVNISNITL